MNIRITSRADIEKDLDISSPYLLISIIKADADYEPMQPSTHRLNYMRMAFDDVDPDTESVSCGDAGCMSIYQAYEVWHFLKKHWGKRDHLVIQCAQGVSQSSAIAAAIAECLDLPTECFWQQHQLNQHVYDLVLEAFDRLGGMGFLTRPDPSSNSYR